MCLKRLKEWFLVKTERFWRKRSARKIQKITDIPTIIGKKLEILDLGNEAKAICITITEPMEIDVMYPVLNKEEAKNYIEILINAFDLHYMEIKEFDMRSL